MESTTLSDEELLKRAEAIYDLRIREKVESVESNIGKILVLDVDSGEYAIDENGIVAHDRLRTIVPEANPVAFRIGYDAMYGLGIEPRRLKP